MKSLTIELPDNVDEKAIKMQLARQLYDKGIIISGQVANLVGISKKEIIETVGHYGVSIFGESVDDLEKIINA
ncbi:UPF0175 family protein [Flavobacterium sp. CS20]|uniref:UPF0175 family protein n=1 Tax=Flavobacterium sp. CS20 TaxID=2775246 RepID=UPI001B3A230E|nr:UPF0175 family protein [Flavobacterium sp. CS20]QTY26013.1 UPF0175 family protein [Flavobacterium sp. CS20]